MSEKYKKTCKYLNYVENLLIVLLTVTGCISISAFAALVGITSSAVGLKIWTITAGITKYMPIMKERRKKQNSIVRKR